MLTDEIRQSISESVLCWLATVDAQGIPNVSPKEMFVASGEDQLLIAQIASPNSAANVQLNPAVCVSFVEIFKQKGFKLRGVARMVEPTQPGFADMLDLLERSFGNGFPVKAIFDIRIESAEPIIAPSYSLFAGTTEEGQIAQALRSYRVRR